MGMRGIVLAMTMPLALAATAAHAAAVKILIENVPNGRGVVHVDLCEAATFLTADCQLEGEAPARQGHVTVTVNNVPPGRYAAVAYHDQNANHELDLNVLGMPREPFGFSRDPPMLLGPPLFKDAAFEVADKDVVVKVRLRR
jgi:uncharacterized protein (DUF2141 family)